MVFADGKQRAAKKRQHVVLHHGGTRGRPGDRPDCHHNINGVHQEKVRLQIFMGKLPRISAVVDVGVLIGRL